MLLLSTKSWELQPGSGVAGSTTCGTPTRHESPVYVEDQLGHSSIKVTVDLYGHLVPGANRSAVDRLAAQPTATSLHPTRSLADEDTSGSAEENWSRGRELNPRPTDYESVALPLSYPGVRP